MRASETQIPLHPWFFTQREHTIVEYGGCTASTFRFDSGVSAVRMTSARRVGHVAVPRPADLVGGL